LPVAMFFFFSWRYYFNITSKKCTHWFLILLTKKKILRVNRRWNTSPRSVAWWQKAWGLEFESGRAPLVRVWDSRGSTRSPGSTKCVFQKVKFSRIQKKKKDKTHICWRKHAYHYATLPLISLSFQINI
jgi:hypothetical protein